jgi:hypothetical protein
MPWLNPPCTIRGVSQLTIGLILPAALLNFGGKQPAANVALTAVPLSEKRLQNRKPWASTSSVVLSRLATETLLQEYVNDTGIDIMGDLRVFCQWATVSLS